MTPRRHRRHLLVFARNPVPGRVKTRLIPLLGAEGATVAYRRMLEATLAACARTAADRQELWVDGPDTHPVLTRLAARLGMSIHTQCGEGLGTRMHAAFAQTLLSADSAVLIGSDCPEYDPAYLDSAFQALEQNDAVLGPATDGGYVLIGLKKAEPRLFQDLPWGTDGVLSATRRQLQHLEWRFLELPAKHDVDEPGDLLHFPHLAQLKNDPAEGADE